MEALNQETLNISFEDRIARIERYLQREWHDLTKYDGETLGEKNGDEPM